MLDGAGLRSRLAGTSEVLIDLGTGDGRYVRTVARDCPDWFAIGIDACREPLRPLSRTAPSNALFVIANVLKLPGELAGLASRLTIICPWGSLLGGLVNGQPALLDGLRAIGRPGAHLEIVVNERALIEQGWSLGEGSARVAAGLDGGGFRVESLCPLDAAGLRAWPTSWARRLASGPQPRAVRIGAVVARPAG
jgi:16S rRNA (adenine(1408)-N(1))-methyltransferase